jgi:general secretion pathway protein K
MVLITVMFFALLLTGTVATFSRRATIDNMISHNREAVARAEALARGGVEIAKALILEDKLQQLDEAPMDSGRDVWARLGKSGIEMEDGAVLTVQVEDAGTRLNINALFTPGEETALADETEAVDLLRKLLEKVIDEMELTPAERELYEIDDLADNLIDWADPDDVRRIGGSEESYYLSQDPPYSPSNHAFLSTDEFRLVEGFDMRLAEALARYVTVYPYVRGGGLNPNTAPPHILALLYADDGVDLELADEDTVKELLEVRDDGGIVCPDEVNTEDCTPIRSIPKLQNQIYPPPVYDSRVFRIVSRAEVGEIERKVVTVLDITQPAAPLLLSWKVE